MWGAPKPIEVPIDAPARPEGHHAITRNFARSILFGEPLLAPGADGLNAVEMINGVILAGHTGKKVSVPVDRAEYEALMADLRAKSRGKSRVREQRITDPKFAK